MNLINTISPMALCRIAWDLNVLSPTGAPARTVGWRDPGFIHTSFLKDLWPNAVYGISKIVIFGSKILKVFRHNPYVRKWNRYTYKLGHQMFDGSYVWSKEYSFKASPYPGQDSLQRVIIFGDMGKVRLYSFDSVVPIFRLYSEFCVYINLEWFLNSFLPLVDETWWCFSTGRTWRF